MHACRPRADRDASQARAYTIPTDKPEADGTLRWDSHDAGASWRSRPAGKTGTRLHLRERRDRRADRGKLAGDGRGHDALDPPARLARDAARGPQYRPRGSRGDRDLRGRYARSGISRRSCSSCRWRCCSARCRDAVPIYGSGGFTTYTDDELARAARGWVERDGCRWVKMKIGTRPGARSRIACERREAAIGDRGVCSSMPTAPIARKQALRTRRATSPNRTWLVRGAGLVRRSARACALLRERAPAGMEIAAGEYGYTLDYFRRMLRGAAPSMCSRPTSRAAAASPASCRAAALCEAHHIDLSGHCAPALHLHVACAAPRLRHLEWFHDHVRIEHMLFDGAPVPQDGVIRPDLSRPGIGLTFKRAGCGALSRYA